jgi:hypothetical protein
MQKAAFACGSMVLYLFCMSFFARGGEKMTYNRSEFPEKRKGFLGEPATMQTSR